jgi:hypothetical protein
LFVACIHQFVKTTLHLNECAPRDSHGRHLWSHAIVSARQSFPALQSPQLTHDNLPRPLFNAVRVLFAACFYSHVKHVTFRREWRRGLDAKGTRFVVVVRLHRRRAPPSFSRFAPHKLILAKLRRVCERLSTMTYNTIPTLNLL